MPSYLSSTQTSGPSRATISAASSAGEASMNLSGWKRAISAVARRVVASEGGQAPDVADQHPGPLHVVERAIEGPRDGRLDEPLAKSDPEVAAEHLDDVLGGQRIGAGEEIAQDGRLAGRTGRLLDLGERGGHLGECRRRLGRRRVTGVARGHRPRRYRGRRTGRMPRQERDRGNADEARDGRRDRRPTESGGALIGRREGTAGQEHGRDRQLLGSQGPQVIGEEGRLLGGPGRGRETLG